MEKTTPNIPPEIIEELSREKCRKDPTHQTKIDIVDAQSVFWLPPVNNGPDFTAPKIPRYTQPKAEYVIYCVPCNEGNEGIIKPLRSHPILPEEDKPSSV